MKVLLVHNSYQWPGGEDGVYQRERDLLKASGDEVIEYWRTNKEINDYSLTKRVMLGFRTVWSSDSRRDFAEKLRASRPDIVHVHNTFMVISPSIYSACREQQVPVVQTLHNYRLLCPGANFYRDGKPCHDCTSNLAHSVLHGCYRGSRASTASVAMMLAWHRASGTYDNLIDRYIALTEFSRSNFVASGFDPNKITVKPNFVYSDPGERDSDGSYAICVGRIEEQKGLHTLLDAWRKLPEPIPLRFAGTGPLVDELKSVSATMPHVQYLGQLPVDQLMQTMKGARFLVFPTQLYENFPLTLAEAYACGLPVIASDLGAMKEIVVDGQTGLLFRPGDAENLSQKVLFAWRNRDLLKRFGKNARQEYEAKYTAGRNYRMLRDIYETVLATKRRSQVLAETRNTNEAVPV